MTCLIVHRQFLSKLRQPSTVSVGLNVKITCLRKNFGQGFSLPNVSMGCRLWPSARQHCAAHQTHGLSGSQTGQMGPMEGGIQQHWSRHVYGTMLVVRTFSVGTSTLECMSSCMHSPSWSPAPCVVCVHSELLILKLCYRWSDDHRCVMFLLIGSCLFWTC